jgi:hypothetical protein
MSRAVHRFKSMTNFIMFISRRNQKEIIFIVFIMTRHFPEVDIEDVWGYHFLEVSFGVFCTHEVN